MAGNERLQMRMNQRTVQNMESIQAYLKTQTGPASLLETDDKSQIVRFALQMMMDLFVKPCAFNSKLTFTQLMSRYQKAQESTEDKSIQLLKHIAKTTDEALILSLNGYLQSADNMNNAIFGIESPAQSNSNAAVLLAQIDAKLDGEIKTKKGGV